jgi:hypothetical protein
MNHGCKLFLHPLNFLRVHSHVKLLVAFVPFVLQPQVILFLILQFLFPHTLCLLQLSLVDLLNLFEPLKAKFFTLECALYQVLLCFPLQSLNLSQELVLACPEMVQSGLMFDLHKLDLLLILKPYVVDFVLEQLILFHEASVV